MKFNNICKGLLVLSIISLFSCTRYDNPAPFFEDYEQEVDKTIKNKVLIINIDGLVGEQLKIYTPTNLTKMLENAKYSYRAQSDNITTDPASLVSLVTGVPSNKHRVFTDSYLPTFENSDPHGDSHFTPSMFYLLEGRDKLINTAVFMRNRAFTGAYLTDADQFVVENTDESVKNRSIERLKLGRTDLMMIQFSDVQNAGKNGGFVNSNSLYKEALDKVDGYVGEILSTIENTAEAEYDNWLVIICSAHGGKADGNYGGATVEEKSTFSMYYNKNFEKTELVGDEMNSFFANGYFAGTWNYYDNTGKPRTFSEDGPRAQSPAGAASNKLNPATYGEMTYDFKIRLRQDTYWAGTTFSGGYRNYYNFIMGKDDSDGGSAGWHIYGQDMSFSLRVQNGSSTESFNFGRGMDGQWNHYAITFKSVTALTTRGSVYVNGELAGSQVFNMPISSFSNDQPLTFGYARQGYQNLSFLQADFADVRVWNKELTKEQVATIVCTKWITESDPLFDNMIAYYTHFEGENKWVNSVKTSGIPDMTITNHTELLSWTNARPACGIQSDYVFLQNIDLVPQVFYWLDIKIDEDWNLPGNLFLNNFENEFKQ